ncbi:hypothetical protein WJX79_002499 [Trebouxia sp. C0005]|nr:MAG: Ribonuclease P family Rpp14 family isoform 1 [Trebouxia sp. A1-2]
MVRFKNRYILYEVIWKDGKADEAINEAGLLAVFRESVAVNFGDHGVAKSAMSLSVRYYNSVTHLCMVRCGTEEYRQVWCALSMINEISSKRAMLHFLHLGGTLKSCQQAAIDYNKRLLDGLRLSQQQSKAIQHAEAKLSNLEL